MTERRITTVSWILVALGSAARVAQFCFCRSLRFDEAKIALNVIDRSFGRLLDQLDSLQVAPLGFLWTERVAILLLGSGERALRLFPLICGVLGLVLFRTLALRLLAPGAALLAITVVSLNGHLVFFANDAKQYACDALATVAILLAATSADVRAPRPRCSLRLLLTGAVALAFSHPACFVLAGVGGAGLIEAAQRRDRRGFLRWTLVAGAWMTAFLAFLTASYGATDEERLREFWGRAFMPFPPRDATDWMWYLKYPVKLFRDPGSMQPAPLIALVFALGCGSLWRRTRWLAITMIATLLLAMSASALHRYPFKDRLLLFLVPLLGIGVAEGAATIGRCVAGWRSRARRSAARLAVAALAVVHPVLTALPAFVQPQTRDLDMATAMEAIAASARPGDVLCTSLDGADVLTYYARHVALSRRGVEIQGLPERNAISALKGRRIWFLFHGTPPREAGSFGLPTRGSEVGQDVVRDYVKSIDSSAEILERHSWLGIELCLARF